MPPRKKKPTTRTRGPRGTKAQIDAVKRNAREVHKELKAEQRDSASHLADTLDEINEGEAVAHLDMRVGFLERQVERLVARRDEADRGLQGELSVMRARIEDALEAVGATAGEQKEAWVSLERQLAGLIASAEGRGADATEALRRELSTELEEALAKLRNTDSRIRGQVKALEEAVSERVRKISESAAIEREEIEEMAEGLSTSLAEALESLAEAESAVAERLSQRLETVEADVAEKVTETLEDFEKRLKDLGDRLEADRRDSGTALSQAAVEAREAAAAAAEQASALAGSVQAGLEENTKKLDAALAEAREGLDERIGLTIGDAEARLEARQREIDGGLSEARADVRLEAHRLKEWVEERSGALDEAIEALARDLSTRVKAAEGRAAAADAHLESLLSEHQRLKVGDDAAREESLKDVMEEVTSLKIRTEELHGRVSSTEARRATERGSTQVAAEALSGRLESLETRVREAVEQVSAKQATRLEVLASRVEKLSEREASSEEESGAVEYLSRQVGEMAERVDEMIARVNAIGRFVTRPHKAPLPKGFVAIPPEVEERLEALERQLAESRAASPAPVRADGTAERLSSLERNVAALVARARSSEQEEGVAPRLDELERTLAQIGAEIRRPAPASDDLDSRLQNLERAVASITATVSSRMERVEKPPEPKLPSRSPSPVEALPATPARDILPRRKKRR